jgi:hypothetical protein
MAIFEPRAPAIDVAYVEPQFECHPRAVAVVLDLVDATPPVVKPVLVRFTADRSAYPPM